MLKEIARLLVVVLVILGSATKLATARNIKLTGAVTGNTNFDGSKNIEINVTQANVAILTGTLTQNMGEGGTKIAYPNGFNKNNCFVVNAFLDNNGGVIVTNDIAIGTRQDNDGIYVSTTPITEIASISTHSVKVILMKTS